MYLSFTALIARGCAPETPCMINPHIIVKKYLLSEQHNNIQETELHACATALLVPGYLPYILLTLGDTTYAIRCLSSSSIADRRG